MVKFLQPKLSNTNTVTKSNYKIESRSILTILERLAMALFLHLPSVWDQRAPTDAVEALGKKKIKIIIHPVQAQ